MVENKGENISEAEAELYDRQIRLWGLDAQRRLRAARVLVVGVGGLAAEVAKNIVLAGVKSLTFLDHAVVTADDFSSNFLLSRTDLGKNRAVSSLDNTQKLNSMVEVRADKEDVAEKPDVYFTHFDVVCVTRCSQEQMIRINDICHKNNVLFFAGDVFGWYGFMFADLNEHNYAEDVQKPITNEKDASGEPSAKKQKVEMETVVVKKTCNFVRLKQALSVDFSEDKYKRSIKRMAKSFFVIKALLNFLSANDRRPGLDHQTADMEQLVKLKNDAISSIENLDIQDDFSSLCFSELSPVCAIIGGIFGQEIIKCVIDQTDYISLNIEERHAGLRTRLTYLYPGNSNITTLKAVSQKDPPHNNFFLYNGFDGSGMVECIGQ